MLTAILVDQREPKFIQDLKFGDVPKVITMLDTGDVWASCDDGELLCIERKTPTDLLGSIKDGRIFTQCAALRQRSQWAYLIITGVLINSGEMVVADNRLTGWRWISVQGALLSIQEAGVSIVYCHDERDFEATVIRLSQRERCKEKVLGPRNDSRVMSPAEQLLCALPGIGLERAQTLLNEFHGEVCQALTWLTWTDTWLEIAGIGSGTKANVRRALGLSDDQWLTVMSPEAAQYAANTVAEKVTA